jgi:hypothetical protein
MTSKKENNLFASLKKYETKNNLYASWNVCFGQFPQKAVCNENKVKQNKTNKIKQKN